MQIFLTVIIAFVLGLILIFFLKTTQPQAPRETVHFDKDSDKPSYLEDREEFRSKCLEFLGKFNLEYRHSVWANNSELEIDMQDETPVVGGKYLALCIFNPPFNLVDGMKVKGFLDSVKGEGAARGIIITTGYFADEAYRQIEEEPVELVNIHSFLKYLKGFDIY
ncbi:restriction endonuclease [Nitrospina watsonii]|uniref:Mrr_cat domain-containing protein n=1 Tax=Nitrospina watsonii TaxID=1323948 RepID=A0ABN8VXD3_9BACT|nr:restriction endonuclease [Nitrospina watsonii]CAI2718402.1 Mrr_cat domain-containing protein [Nitrospina watsonii]